MQFIQFWPNIRAPISQINGHLCLLIFRRPPRLHQVKEGPPLKLINIQPPKIESACRIHPHTAPHLWQYGLWSFQTGGTKLERFLPKNQHTERKLLNFVNWVSGEVSKIGRHFSK